MRAVVILMLWAAAVAGQTDEVYQGRDTTSASRRKPPKEREWAKKFTYGGNFQLWFGNPTFVFLSPTIGYNFLKDLNGGVGVVYNYTQFNNGIYGKFSQSIFGGHSYLRYIIASSYFVQTQFDRLYQPDFFSFNPEAKLWVNYWLVGGGLRQPVGSKAAITTSLMYNLTPSPLSIYPGRLIVQFGFIGGF